MRVLHLVGFYPEIGGPFTVVKTLCTKLAQKGIKIKVLSPIPKNYDRTRLGFIKDLPFKVEYIEEQLPRYIWPSFSLKFLNKIKENDADLVHVAGIFDFYTFALLFSDKKYIFSSHGTFMKEAYNMIRPKKIKKDIYMKLLGKKILDRAKVIHLLTNEEKGHFLNFYPEYENKVKIIPNGIDISEFDVEISKEEILNKYPPLKNKKIILFLGRLNWIKGLDLLIPAFYKLSLERKDVHLLIAGKDDGDGYEEKLRMWVKQYKLDNNVTFTGLLTGKDKVSAFKIADVFVLPSYSENFGVAVIEAMACGVPVVVSDKVGICKEVQEHKAGLIVKTEVKSIYQGLKKMLEDEQLRRELSENGRDMVKKYYDIEVVANKVIEMYEEVLKNG